MTDVKLMPCPFCGGEGGLSYSTTVASPTSPAHWFVECGDCSACGEPFAVDDMDGGESEAKDSAIAAWNTRVNSHDALVEALQQIKVLAPSGTVFREDAEAALKAAGVGDE